MGLIDQALVAAIAQLGLRHAGAGAGGADQDGTGIGGDQLQRLAGDRRIRTRETPSPTDGHAHRRCLAP